MGTLKLKIQDQSPAQMNTGFAMAATKERRIITKQTAGLAGLAGLKKVARNHILNSARSTKAFVCANRCYLQ